MTIRSLMLEYEQRNGLERGEGVYATAIDEVKLHRFRGGDRQPLLYNSGIIVVGRGSKRVYLGERTLEYGAGTYFVLGTPMPLECKAVEENGQPILGMSIDVKPETLQKLVATMTDADAFAGLQSGCGPRLDARPMAPVLSCAIEQLLSCLLDPLDAKVLGASRVEEVVYRVLQSPSGHVLRDLAFHNGPYARIARVLNTMHRDYAEAISVDALAAQVNMSVSGFHKAFKEITTDSPVQYLKKVRLSKARELIGVQGKKASEVALLVGYVSTSQFNREFKRYFNTTPGALLRERQAG